MGLNGARIIKIAATMRIEDGILSRKVHMIILRKLQEQRFFLFFR